MANAVADARTELVQAIEDMRASSVQALAWKKVEKAIDFFENTVDLESYEMGKKEGMNIGNYNE